MRLHDAPFRRIKDGIQKIESRLFDSKRKQLSIGDVIVFTHRENLDEKVHVKITGLFYYPTFNEMYEDLHAKYFAHHAWEELEHSMYRYYSAEEEKEHGAIGIRMELLIDTQ